ncbi:siroheme synthase CysG [Roseomonas elaeocarpi]|uniref:Siroheme synthase CysG n=1 Tax=Roseomonas elaeocarpi TaxID=907779 RepID=A0ABV6JN78_9PROT
MRYFPLFLDLQDRDVLLLGGGEALEGKAALLRRAGARLRHVDHFAPEMLEGVALAVAAGAPEHEMVALSQTCRASGIPCNVVDRTELCGFIMPAIIERDPVLVAVSTAGTSPVLARMIRQKIEAVLAPGIGRLAALCGRFQRATRARLPDLAARRRFLDGVLTGPAAELALAGRDEEATAAFAEALERAEERPAGMVHLVGAGPGAADLLTLRAQRLLGEADVVVHDRLVSAEVLDCARRDAEFIFVGKARANHCVPQAEINALLVQLAREGRRVVRLKGGDPFIFGRGGEEAEALAKVGIAHEVVPGITAALACAAQAGIPLTHRDCARSVTFVTGHTRDGRLDVDFASLARPGQTLAVYMGATTLPQLSAGLRDAGYDLSTPAALIERGGSPAQRTLRGTFAEVVANAPDWLQEGPAMLLLGEACARGGNAQAFCRAVAARTETLALIGVK